MKEKIESTAKTQYKHNRYQNLFKCTKYNSRLKQVGGAPCSQRLVLLTTFNLMDHVSLLNMYIFDVNIILLMEISRKVSMMFISVQDCSFSYGILQTERYVHGKTLSKIFKTH